MLLFWDEPTISLDMVESPLHQSISKMWKSNRIPHVILSSATLPKTECLSDVIQSFYSKFGPSSMIHTVKSDDKVSNICLHDIEGGIIMPHNYFISKSDLNAYINEIDKSYYKYFPTNECASFIFNYCKSFNLNLNEIFEKDIIDNKIIKSTYLKIILNSDEEQFKLYRNWKSHGEYEVGTNFVSDHAHGLKYGPSIYLTQDYMNVIKFSIHKSNIPKNSLTDIQKNIESNDRIQTRINELENTLTTVLNDKFGDKEDVKNNSREIQKIQDDINRLHKKILPITLPYEYIPNTKSHFERFNSDLDFHNSNAFSSSLDDDSNRLIMNLDIDFKLKLAFLLGIGVFLDGKIFDTNKIIRST